jgi:hypothetical protein
MSVTRKSVALSIESPDPLGNDSILSGIESPTTQNVRDPCVSGDVDKLFRKEN